MQNKVWIVQPGIMLCNTVNAAYLISLSFKSRDDVEVNIFQRRLDAGKVRV